MNQDTEEKRGQGKRGRDKGHQPRSESARRIVYYFRQGLKPPQIAAKCCCTRHNVYKVLNLHVKNWRRFTYPENYPEMTKA